MASKKELQRLLGGNVRLLPPADKLNPSDALYLQNWRMDTMNKLVCRGGSVKEFGPIGSGRFHSIFHGNNFAYSGIGTELYYGRDAVNVVEAGFDGNAIGMVAYQGAVWAMNQGRQTRVKALTALNWGLAAPASAPVATGGGQLIHVLEPYDGTSGQNNVTVSAPDIVPVAPFNVAMAQDVSEPGDDGTNIYANPGYVVPVFSQGLQLEIQQACTVTAEVGPAGVAPVFDTTTEGEAEDDDTFQFQVAVSDPTKIISFSISMTDNANGYAECNFQVPPSYGGTFFSPAKFLSQTPGAWATIQIKRQVNLDSWAAQVAAVVASPPNQQSVSDIESQYAAAVTSPAFAYVGKGSPQTGLPVPPVSSSQLPFNWAAVTSISISFVVSDAVQINLQTLEVIGTVSASITGSIQYYVSFFNNDFQDSNPSPPSNAVIFGNESITLTSLPISPDPQTRGRFIWRIGGGISQALQVGVIWDNVTEGPWVDGTSNDTAQDDGITMPINRDPAPPCISVMGPFYGKLVAWNTPDHPARYFWTPAAQPWFFPGSNDDDVGNWEDVGGDDDPILKIIQHPTLAVIYKQRSIWRLPGDPASLQVSAVRTNANLGLVGPQAAVNGGALDYFVGPEGVYNFNLDFETKISTDIDPIFKGDFVALYDDASGVQQFLPPINKAATAQIVLELTEDRLRMSYPSYYSTKNDTVAVFHIPSGRWGFETYDNLPAPAFTAMLYGGVNADGLARTLIGGITTDEGAYSYRLEQTYQDDSGEPIIVAWQTPFYDQGLPDNFKWYSDLELEFRTQIAPLTPLGVLSVVLLLDNGTRVITIAPNIASPDRVFQSFRLVGDESLGIPAGAGVPYGLRAKNWALRITGSISGGATAEIYGAVMHWYPEERTADTFDSGFTNLGLPERCKEIDYLELYMTASGGNLSTQLASDLPGNVLTYRTAWGDLPTPVGRGTVRFRLPDSVGKIDGRNFRFQVQNTPTDRLMQIHQARIRMRPIGEYIDGSIGEYYESPEFAIAPNRVGELKDFLLDYDVTGEGGSLVIYTDLPGTELTIRRTMPIPFQGGTRGIYVFPLESAADVTSDSLPTGQLFKVRLYPPPGGVLRLHGRAQFRARVIGVYFNGTNGEIWESQPVDLLGGVALFREACVVAQTAGPMLFQLFEELPNQDVRVLGSFTVAPNGTTPGRLPCFGRFPGSTKGMLVKARLSGPYICRLFEVKLMSRRVMVNASQWDWHSFPGIEPTLDSWADVPMPVRVTPESFDWVDLPVDDIG